MMQRKVYKTNIMRLIRVNKLTSEMIDCGIFFVINHIAEFVIVKDAVFRSDLCFIIKMERALFKPDKKTTDLLCLSLPRK